MRPLEGIRILDLTRVLSGPYCTMLLGDLGAEVIKVERPGEGDDTRAFAPPFQGDQAAYFLSINRNKKSITLDMKSERGKEILWVNYDDAISMHPVITTKPEERRAQRLATPTPLDNRISYGCINVPVRFYEKVVKPAFTGTDGIVYVLPETRPALEVFNAYDVEAPSRMTVR